MGNRTCHAEGCGTAIPRGVLMCPGHWRQVGHTIQRRVMATWRAVRLCRGRQQSLRLPPDVHALTARYREAIEAARAFLVTVGQADDPCGWCGRPQRVGDHGTCHAARKVA